MRDFIYLEDEPVGVVDQAIGTSASMAWVHGDHLTTPRAVTSSPSSGAPAVIWRASCTPFGSATPDEDPDGDSHAFAVDLRFPGQIFDGESGLHYNYFRQYDPATGRYLESDPIGLGGGLNTYAYAVANPIGFADPIGLQACGGGRCPAGPLSESEQGECCIQAEKELTDPKPNGFVACCRGIKTICPLEYRGTDPLERIFTTCMRKHEAQHPDDMVCKVDENCTRYRPAVYLTEEDRHRSECKAYGVSLGCLAEAVPACGGSSTEATLRNRGIRQWLVANGDYRCRLALPQQLIPRP